MVIVRNGHAWFLVLLFVLAFTSSVSLAATIEQETMNKLDQIRSVKAGADEAATDRYNRQMDDAWKFFIANKQSVLPILRKELEVELKKTQPNELVLLDIGNFVYLHGDSSDKNVAKHALFSVNTTADIVRANYQQLFRFTHLVAGDRDPQVLTFIDKTVLPTELKVFIPQHYLKLDGTLMCVFLYGIYGPDAEGHLKTKLSDPRLARRVIETLVWVGSPSSVQEVKRAMLANRDYETFTRATAFMMQSGGPEGRATMLAINPKDFDSDSQQYYAKIRGAIEGQSYDALRKGFAGIPGDSKLSDQELKKRLTAMYANYGKDDKTSPEAILNSGLPKDFLISELTRIRSRMFYRISDEALSDVQVTNTLINTLLYSNK